MGELEVSKFEELSELIAKSKPNDGIKIKRDDGAGKLTLEDPRFRLSLTINENWIGYEFLLKKSILGTALSSWADTDNYALDFDEEVTESIYQEVKRFVGNLLSNKIYYGKIKGRPVLALPHSRTEYFLSYAPRFHFFTKNAVVPYKEIMGYGDMMVLDVTHRSI